jgi:hypothetical protein
MNELFISLPLKDYIHHSVENKDLFWINLGYNFSIIKKKFLYIAFDLFNTRFGITNKLSKQIKKIFYYYRKIIYSLDSIVCSIYSLPNNYINYDNLKIPSTHIMMNILPFFNIKDLNIIFDNNKTKKLSNSELNFIHQLISELEFSIQFIQNQNVINEHIEFKQIIKSSNKINKIIANLNFIF